ncbi:hypothetical protein, partial [Burkholderia cepacia]|uniref:hypothetical protein n=1 Tax=Burkholderia cepacia TaxID=292 RepID=UPI001F1F411E
MILARGCPATTLHHDITASPPHRDAVSPHHLHHCITASPHHRITASRQVQSAIEHRALARDVMRRDEHR